MAHDRRTLALIIICLPILATVITAFRVRDLPKSHDSTKLDTKICENCDVKVGQKVHSAKTDSDKHKYDDLKKSVREKASETKTTHKYDVRSDEDDDDDDDLQFPKIQTGFRQEFTKDIKFVKTESSIKKKLGESKPKSSVHKKDEDEDVEDNVDDDEDDDDDSDEKFTLTTTSKATEIKKTLPEKNKVDISKSVPAKLVVKNHKTDTGDSEDNVKSSKILSKMKVPDIKIPSSLSKHEEKKSVEIKHAKKETPDKKNNDSNDDDSKDDDDYEGLDNIDELFKILDMKPSTKLKSVKTDINEKTKPHMEVKNLPIKDSKKINDNENDDDDDEDDEDDDDDDDEDDNNESGKTKERNLKIVLTKSPTPSKESKDKSEIIIKKQPAKTEEKILKQDQKHETLSSSEESIEIQKKSPSKLEEVKRVDKETIKESEVKKQDMLPKDGKTMAKSKKEEQPVKKNDHIKPEAKEKLQINKEDNKAKDKPKPDAIKKPKETDNEKLKAKPQEKGDKSSNYDDMKVDKTHVHEPKKDQTDHKDIFKTPELKKDIKYDFEKPNAYKDSARSFDYSEFEKMQVLKSHHKDNKKKDKSSGEKITDSREEKYLKQVTDALNRRNLLKSEFDDFYAFFPTFAPNFSRIHNPECRRHGQILLRQLRGTKLWALNMLDATAKVPSGVLQGNGIQLGDFDQCLGTKARVQLDTGSVVKVQGKYCLARIDVKAENTELEAPVYLAQAKSLIRSRIDDPGHFVPRFSTLSWGVCVPSPCDREDVEVIIKDAVKHYQHKSGFIVKVKVDEDDCQTDEDFNWDEWLELPTVLTLALYGVVIILVLVATVLDAMAQRQSADGQAETDEQELDQTEKEGEDSGGDIKKQSYNFLASFSLYRSINKLISPGTDDEISCIHGIRGIATVALLIAHKFMPVAVMPYTNRLRITELASSPLWSWCRAGWIFTDCFLLLSGTLTSHRIADTGAARRLFSRYLRLTPALLAVVLFYAFVWDKLSTGPMWGMFVTKNAKICEDNWWWNLLYVQNYFGMEDMCAPQTHQLALDMQLTILGGIIIWAVQSELTFARLILPAVHLISGYFRYTTVRDHRLTLLAYHGVSVSQLYRTARLSYISTLHRCSPYLIGISLGLALKKPSKHGKFILTLGWLTSIGLGAMVVWAGIDSGSTQYRYNATFAAQYATIAPLASAMAISWIIYAVHTGKGGFLSRVLCWRPLVFISRLSYALYLCQFIIFITNIGTVRTSREFTLMSLIDVQEISAILLSSTILTVTFVIPMQSLHKIFSFEWKSEPEKSPEKEIKESEPNTEEQEEKKEITPPTRSRHNLVAHREVLEEIPEAEVEYETQRETTEGLEEIVEEEEEGLIGEEDDDLEIIEEEEAGEEEAWLEREGERSFSRADEQDLDEWEWTANGRSGAQYYRYAR